MSDVAKCCIELWRREQHADGTWGCHYVIFEFGTQAWRCKKGSVVGIFGTLAAAEAAALRQAQQIIDSRHPSAVCL